MAKMIKIVYEVPEGVATRVEHMPPDIWPPSTEMEESWELIRSKIYYDSPNDVGYKSETANDPNNPLRVIRYYYFDNYPSETPTNLRQWFWRTRRKIDSEHCADVEEEILNPLTGENEIVRYNLFQRWNSQYRIKNNIKTISIEEVEHEFPAR